MDPNQSQPQPPIQPPQQPPYPVHQENPGQTFGIVSIIMIFVFPLLGIIFGAISRSKSKAANMPTGLGTAGLIINIVLSVLGLLAFILFFVLVVLAANNAADNGSQGDNSGSGSSGSSSHAALKATSASDFDEVCDGTPISNAAPLTSKASALITTFYHRPDSGSSSWTSAFVGFRKPYYLEDRQNFASVSIVACAKGTQAGAAKQCAYESKTIDYYGARYDVTFYEAKTAKKLGSGTFEETNTSCPSFVSYNTQTNSAVATPTDAKYEAVIDTFIAQ